MKYLQLVALLLSLALFSCTPKKNSSFEQIGNITPEVLRQGETIVLSQCIACHNAQASEIGRIAPPMIAVKRRYSLDTPSFEVFKNRISLFMKDPSENRALMYNAVRKFGVMPKLSFTDNQLDAISAYIYYTEQEKPEWFDAHWEESHDKIDNEEESNDMTKLGLQLAMKTKKVLGKNLMKQINNNGTIAALTFCDENAYHLTDSMSMELDTDISRVSDLPRNPDNQANKKQLEYIEIAKQALEDGKPIIPLLTEDENVVTGFYPIITNKMCLQCHGTLGKELKSETHAKIKELYPNDLAIGYKENQLRGIWVVEMIK
ncbi:c-type heme family protein [Reichenbachiella versicolor]|uniref:c-type heme family protein n=1 Tax=Reichenbachiella versicolor TaxID=1821036 RepID=UPI000D6E2631|nr:DUF3365 domain-containing protein [Reichenbachiella versicolor]